MEGLGVVYEQEEPAVDTSNQQTPAGDSQAVVAHEDDEEIRALAGNPDDLDQQPQQQQLQQQTQQYQQEPQQHESYGHYGQSSDQHPQQQMEHHGGVPRDGPQPGKLFIGGVSWETTEDTLRQHFGKYGELTDAALMKDKYTGQPRGFGFVTFADATAIDRVLDETHNLDGRSVEVKRAIPRERSTPGGSSDFRGGRGGFGAGGAAGGYTEQKKIFVGGLATSVTEQDFRHYFEEYGKITDAVVMIDRETQRSRGFGFITFEDEASVAEVLSKSHEIHGKVVEIKRAEPKEARAGGGGGYAYGGGGRGRGGGFRGGGRSGGGGYGAGASGGYGAGASAGYGSGYGGGYGGGYGRGYGGGYGGGYGAAGYGAAGYSADGYGAAAYAGYPQSYAGYGYGGYGGGYGGRGGYGGYSGYGYGAGAGGEGAAAGREGGAGGEEGGNGGEEAAGQGGAAQSGQGAAAGGYGYGGGGYRQGGGASGAQGGSGGRSDRYRPY